MWPRFDIGAPCRPTEGLTGSRGSSTTPSRSPRPSAVAAPAARYRRGGLHPDRWDCRRPARRAIGAPPAATTRTADPDSADDSAAPQQRGRLLLSGGAPFVSAYCAARSSSWSSTPHNQAGLSLSPLPDHSVYVQLGGGGASHHTVIHPGRWEHQRHPVAFHRIDRIDREPKRQAPPRLDAEAARPYRLLHRARARLAPDRCPWVEQWHDLFAVPVHAAFCTIWGPPPCFPTRHSYSRS